MTDSNYSVSGSAHSDCAIVLTVDAKFLPFGLFLIDQIAVSNPERDFDFCIVSTDDLPTHPLIDRHHVRLCCLDISSILDDFPASDRISVATYLRFYVSKVLSSDYRRLLYLDSDIYYRRGDLNRLLRVDLQKRPLAGARDPVQFRRKGFVPPDMRGLGLGYFKYLSAGVQLIDTETYNSQEIGERAVALAKSESKKMTVFDQTAINAVLKGNFAELPPVWNWLYGFRTAYFTELYNPAFVHFAGRRKPWSHLTGELPTWYSAAYLDFFREHFPDNAAAMPVIRPASASKLAHLRIFANHAKGLWRLVPHLDTFDDEFDLHFDR